jgi:thermitase
VQADIVACLRGISRLSLRTLRAIVGTGIVTAVLLTLSGPTMAKPPAFAAGRILVAPKAGVTDADFGAALAAHGAHSQGKLRGLNVHLVTLPPGQSESDTVAKLARHPLVKFAELDEVAAPAGTTNDPYLANEWHLPKIDALTAWNSSIGTGTIIAILDTGVDSTHPDLAAQVVPGWNAYDNNSNTADVYGHGTGVAGTAAAAANNATGVASVAWGARIMPIRITDSSGYAYWSVTAQGLTWAADNGARVANISFLGVAASSTVQSAAQYMRNKGGVVAVSAGNNGIDEGTPSTDTMIVVSATDSSDTKTSWSSYGAFVDLAAPGQGIYTTARGGGYQSASGTSFSSPIVAGVAALVKGMHPEFTAAQIESALFSSAVDLGATGKDTLYGYGRVSASGAVAAAGSVPVDTTAPTVAIGAPTGGTVSGSVSVSVNASDNTGVARVELWANGQLVGTDTSSPYSFSWNSASVADGAATLTAAAYDAAGNTASSTPVAVTVANSSTKVADTTPPTVAITNPGNGTKVGKGSVTVSASASDAGGLASVKLSIDGVTVASGNTGTLSYKWNTRNVAAGAHTISVSAQDTAGNTAPQSISVTK